MDVFNAGDYVRWVSGHSVYAASGDVLTGEEPIYRYGIVIEVSSVDPGAIIVHARSEERGPHLVILSQDIDEIEVLSKG